MYRQIKVVGRSICIYSGFGIRYKVLGLEVSIYPDQVRINMGLWTYTISILIARKQ